jgi:hypothetical protein
MLNYEKENQKRIARVEAEAREKEVRLRLKLFISTFYRKG